MAGNILIVYYTRTQNTATIAQLIQTQVGGTLHEVQPVKPYPLAYNDTTKIAKQEIRDGYLPPIKSDLENLNTFDTIFVGTPNWWSTMAPPLATFLSKHDFSGKTVVPFCTHGGGGLNDIERDMHKLCSGAKFLEPFEIYGNGGSDAEAQVKFWLEKTNY
jgi:flavodoxin